MVGFVPEGEPAVLDPSAVSELLFELTRKSVGHLVFLNEDAPDFESKMTWNDLTSPVSDKLRSNAPRIRMVDDFLAKNDSGTRQAVAQEVHAHYEAAKAAIPDSTEEYANVRYGHLVLSLIPDKANVHPHTLAAYRDAAEVVVAKYFETCDAYEHPDSPLTS